MGEAPAGGVGQAALKVPESRWERQTCARTCRLHRRWTVCYRGTDSTEGRTGANSVFAAALFVPAMAVLSYEATQEHAH